jgi:hypothetical protein
MYLLPVFLFHFLQVYKEYFAAQEAYHRLVSGVVAAVAAAAKAVHALQQ